METVNLRVRAWNIGFGSRRDSLGHGKRGNHWRTAKLRPTTEEQPPTARRVLPPDVCEAIRSTGNAGSVRGPGERMR